MSSWIALAGVYAMETIIILVVVVLLVVSLLWQLLQVYYRQLWQWGNVIWSYITRMPPVERLGQKYPWLWSFLGNRLSPHSYAGLHLTIGLLVMLAAISLFSNIAETVVEKESLVQVDQALSTALHQNSSPLEVALFRVVTDFGDTPVLVIVSVFVGLMLAYSRLWLLMFSWIITVGGSALLNILLKAVFQRPRPEFAEPLLVETYWSFPSGHAMNSLATYGMLAYLLLVFFQPYIARIGIAVLIALVLLIGFSRMYLGVHYFSDVIAGYTAGAVWLAIMISGTEVARRYKRQQQFHSETVS